MQYSIQNGVMEAVFSDAGAELLSLKKGDQEYLWHGDPAFWGRRSPVLFPFVGQVRDKVYRWQGKEYTMGQHGFARDRVFSLKEQTEHTISFLLRDDEESRKIYPFAFELEVAYELLESGLKVQWIVRNPSSETMYFSVGGHPAFLCPLEQGADWDAYRIGFDKDGSRLTQITIRPITKGGCVGEATKKLDLENGTLVPTDDLFSGDALILEDYQVDEVSLAKAGEKPYLTVRSDAPLMGVWSPVRKHAPFICLEPWYGRTDIDTFTGDLSERAYGQKLEAGGTFSGGFEVKIG